MATKKSLNLTDLFYKKSETRTRQEITDEITRAIFNLELFVFAESYNKLPTGTNIRPNKVYIVPNIGSNIQNNRFDFYMYYNNQWERLDAPDFDIEDYVKISDIMDNVTSNAADKPLSANQGKVLKALIDNKVDNVTGKGLSTNDFTNTYKSKLDNLDNNLNNKVDKIEGKGLSEADFTNTEKTKLAGIATGATRVIVDNKLDASSTNPVQNKVIVEEYYDKDEILDLLNNIQTASGKLLSISIDETTGDLIVDDDSFVYYTQSEVDEKFTIDVVKQPTPDSGFLTTYVIKQGNVAVGTKINIPKDFLIKSASINTSNADNTPISGIMKGDKYFDFVLNTKEGSAADEHLYLNAKDLVDTYSADESTLTMDANNVFSIKSVPVAKITGTLPANQVTHQDISGKANTADLATVATTGNYNDLTNKPTSMVPTSHTHGNLTNEGKIGTTANNPLITTANGVVTTGSFEASSSNIKMNGTANVGALNTFARADHIHPVDTSRAEASHNHDDRYYTETEINTKLDDYLTSHQDISGKEDISNKTTAISSSSTDTQYPSAKATYTELNKKANTSDLATVATSGNYDDLINKPDVVEKSIISGLIKNDGTIDTNQYLTSANVPESFNYGYVDSNLILHLICVDGEVTATNSVIQSGDTNTITAVITDKDNNPLEGMPVEFLFNGVKQGETINSNSMGIATCSYTGMGVGEVDVQVRVGSFLSETYEVLDCIKYYQQPPEEINIEVNSPICIEFDFFATSKYAFFSMGINNNDEDASFGIATNYTPTLALFSSLGPDSAYIIPVPLNSQNHIKYKLYDEGNAELYVNEEKKVISGVADYSIQNTTIEFRTENIDNCTVSSMKIYYIL